MKTIQQLLATKKHQEVISIAPHRPVFDALVVMAEYEIGALMVLEGDKLVGIFSERDYAREVVLKGKSSKTTAVSEVMTANVISVKLGDTVEQAMTVMTEKRIRHLPVLDNGKVVGMLSIGDLVKETIAYQQGLIKQLESYITG
jgi:CBS domain-containing protein